MLAPTDKVEIPQEEVKEKPTLTKEGTITVTSDEGTNFLKGKINEILGEDDKDVSKNDAELNSLLEWAWEKGAKSLEDVLWEVRDLANHLGTPGYGESRLKFIHQYIYLQNEGRNIENKLKKMEGFNKSK